MRTLLRRLAWLTAAALPPAALAGPHEEGLAAGAAANPTIRGSVDAGSAAAVVPGVTATPPERAYSRQPNLPGQAATQLANCALFPDDPVCAAQRGALQSANQPRDAVNAADPGVAPAKAIARHPSLELGSLASYYAGCNTAETAVPAATETRLCHRYAGIGNVRCTRSLAIRTRRSDSCTRGDWFAQVVAGTAGFAAQCLPDQPDSAQHFRLTRAGQADVFFDADLTVARPMPQAVVDLGPAANADASANPPHQWLWLVDTRCSAGQCAVTAVLAPDRVEACAAGPAGGTACAASAPFVRTYAACPAGQLAGDAILRTDGALPAAAPAPSSAAAGRMVIDYYGDSTVWGYASGSGSQVDRPAPAVFADALGGSARVEVRNEGVSGSTACELLHGSDGRHPPWEAQMAASSAGYVIINHAINDQWKESVDDYRACLTTLARIATQHGKHVLFETPNPTRDSGAGGLDTLVQVMREVAAAQHLPLIDQYAYLTARLAGASPLTQSPDGLHPSDATYALKGEYAATVFAGLFGDPVPPGPTATTLDAARCYVPSATPTALAGSDRSGTITARYWSAGAARAATGWQPHPAMSPPMARLTLHYAKPAAQWEDDEGWDEHCPAPVAGGRCTLVSADVCVEGPATRQIDGHDVSRACWRTERTYACAGGPPLNDCAPLAAAGCTPAASRCAQADAITGACEIFQDSYQCPTPARADTAVTSCPGTVFCLGASCFNTAAARDADFARVMTYLEAAREAGVYLDTDRLQVFTGERNRCRERLLANCCSEDSRGADMSNRSVFGLGSRLVYDVLMNADNRAFVYQGLQALLTGAGFNGGFSSYGVTVTVNGTALPAGSVTLYAGDSVALAFDPWSLAITALLYTITSATSCDEEEGRLAMKEGAHLCHAVGTYCSSCLRVLGRCVSCVTRSTAKCCFNSVLARLVNEQGRAQVGKAWGSPENPDCSGFTVAELQALDFAAMDLSEFYAAIVPTLPNVGALRSANAARLSQIAANPRATRGPAGSPPPPRPRPPAPSPPKPGGPGPTPAPRNDAVSPYGQDPTQYASTFAEEFENGFNTALWNDTIWYESPPATRNYTVENGVLKIWPQRDGDGRFFNRTIDTDGKFTQTYGFFEIEAKLPLGKGTWPAFWLFNHIGSRRPEIDVMEAYAGGVAPWGFTDGDGIAHPQAYAPTIWVGDVEGNRAGTRQFDTGLDLAAGFHKYAIKWEPNRQTFYFDGREVLTVPVSMGDPMYLMLDLWFGGDSGTPDEATPTGKANAYEINYVRAWEFR